VIVEERTNSKERFKLYPNPSIMSFIVELPVPSEKKCLFSVYNMYGILAEKTAIPSGTKKIKVKVSTWPEGVYLGVLSSKGKMLSSKRFVVTK